MKFTSVKALNKCKNLWYNTGYGDDRKLLENGLEFSETKTELYEAQIPPLLRLFHIRKIKPSGWVALKSGCYVENKKRLTKSPSIQADDFIERFCNKLELDEESTKIIIEICKKSMDNNIISENTPPSIAAGCIFYYIKEHNITKISKKDISSKNKKKINEL